MIFIREQFINLLLELISLIHVKMMNNYNTSRYTPESTMGFEVQIKIAILNNFSWHKV